MHFIRLLIFSFLLIFIGCTQPSKKTVSTDIYDSGGVPIPEQELYDVTFYDLNLDVNPEEEWIGGNLEMTAKTLKNLDVVVLHLDTLLEVSRTQITRPFQKEARWERKKGLIYVYTDETVPAGSIVSVNVHYAGHPLKVEDARRRSWSDGFYFEETPNGDPWVNNVSVLNGADIWFPCKDHPSDEPDSMAINITVDEGLVVAGNGRFRGITENDNQTNTHHWFISTPVNNYGVTVNIAPYRKIETEYTSVTGETFPFIFWAIPEHYEQAQKQFPNFQKDMRFLEKTLGPYPFRADKYGVAETYYYGMETQSIIAYGNDFTLNEYGFDGLHFHELVHEWFANMVTARDWKHWWIHESFASYLEPLYAEYIGGEEAYHSYMEGIFNRVQNEKPIVLSQEHVTTREGYHGDVYGKGATILHTLRYLMGKEKMLRALRRLTYPDPAMEQVTDGSHTRLSDTDEFREIFEEHYGKNLEWFFDAYFFYAQPPRLLVNETENGVNLQWETESDYPFTLPVPVEVNGEMITVAMNDEKGSFESNGAEYSIDPQQLILKEVITN